MKRRFRIPKIQRTTVLVVSFIVLFFVMIGRVYLLQIVKGEEYANNLELKMKRTLVVKGTRGNIYDRNGVPLARNELAYSITLEDSGVYETDRERQLSLNSIAYHIKKLTMENGERLNNELKILVNGDGRYQFTEEGIALLRFKADVFGKVNIEDMTTEESKSTADDIIEHLCDNAKFALYGEDKEPYTSEELQKYNLKEHYTKEEVLDIMGIRYMLSLNTFQKYLPVTVAQNVSQDTMTYILEHKDSIQGVDIQEDWQRVYDGGEAFAHILGYTGKISSEELEDLKDKNPEYDLQSVVGKNGIEQTMDEMLQGNDGEREVYVNNMGRVLQEGEKKTEPAAGKDIYLSIDKDLQIAAYQILEQQIAGVLAENIVNAKEFDKTSVADASDVKIPIYDIYDALINNQVIELGQLSAADATQLEQSLNQRIKDRVAVTTELIRSELTVNETAYQELSEEMQDYATFLIEEFEMLSENSINKKDETYLAWSEGKTISIKEYLMYAINEGWVDLSKVPTEDQYLSSEEIYQILVENTLKQLETNSEFVKKLIHYMLREDSISGSEICQLLYDQGVLQKEDDQYTQLMENRITAYDLLLQKINGLEITPAQLALDPYSGSAVVVEAGTGKVLASVTYPGYDNNRLANVMDNQYYYKLYEDKSMPFFDRATQQLTAPGSTFKPVTIIAGMQEQVINENTSIFCDGVFDKVTPHLKCWNYTGHGHIENASSAIANSCNDYLADISYRLGMLEREEFKDEQALAFLQEYSKMFDLDKKSGIEITESSPQVTDYAAIPSAIGQGTHNYSTVQLARYVNTLATKGSSFQLSLIEKVKEAESITEEVKKPKIQSTVELPDNVWNTVSSGMQQFVQSNEMFKDIKLTVAGKSGTAQEAKDRPDHALFVGYAPVENPQISLSVRIANGYASGNAVAVGRDILNYYFGLEKKEDLLSGNASEAHNTRSD